MQQSQRDKFQKQVHILSTDGVERESSSVFNINEIKGVNKESFQSRSVTASLLMKRNKRIRKKYSLLFWLRNADTLWKPVGGKRDMIPAERDHVWMGAAGAAEKVRLQSCTCQTRAA